VVGDEVQLPVWLTAFFIVLAAVGVLYRALSGMGLFDFLRRAESSFSSRRNDLAGVVDRPVDQGTVRECRPSACRGLVKCPLPCRASLARVCLEAARRSAQRGQARCVPQADNNRLCV